MEGGGYEGQGWVVEEVVSGGGRERIRLEKKKKEKVKLII